MKYMLLYVNVDFISAVLQTGGVQARPGLGWSSDSGEREREGQSQCPMGHFSISLV